MRFKVVAERARVLAAAQDATRRVSISLTLARMRAARAERGDVEVVAGARIHHVDGKWLKVWIEKRRQE